MGIGQFLEKEKVWSFVYKNGLYCPFRKGRKIRAGSLDCVNCPAFISVDRNRVKHTTVLKCRGHSADITFRTFFEHR
ncbi:MAG TPA: hypothetical protein DEQ14_09570 [Treponema sp.]|nr:hypothetical protein [Treponema sp.]